MKKRLAKVGRMTLSLDKDKIIMSGGKYGPHYLYAQGYTDRVQAHWIGYLSNNGVRGHGHPEYFPD